MKRWVLWTVLILLIIAPILIGSNLDFKSLVSLDETALLLLFKSRIPGR